VRFDTVDYPVVITRGSVFVTAGTDRRSSGTHYTPKSLTEPIVQYTLEPLVYVGPGEGLPKEEWKLRSANELLDLKICDMACGSGAFLVQACRYMAARLLEAWDAVQRANPGTVRITPDGEPSTGQSGEMLIPDDPDERQTYALRIVAQRCLYGVDKNPLAAEMAKLSLWLLTLAKDKPFEFLDHAIRCGDSLVGIHYLDQLRRFNLNGKGEDNRLFLQFLDKKVTEVIALRHQITEMQANTVEDVEAQDRILRDANEKIDRLKCAADMLISADFVPGSAAGKQTARVNAAIKVAAHFNDSDLPTFRREVQKALAGQVTFHWPLEFPEVMVERGGFDAFVGNPPFMGGQKITGNLGTDYRDYLVAHLARGKRGSADLCSYFFLRAVGLLREGGQCGFLATNTIAQGDTREVGLDQLTANGCVIPRAVPSRKWPGTASLEVAHIWLRKGRWASPFVLDDKPVSGVTSFLTEPGTVSGPPHRLAANAGKSFQGSIVLGMGFVLESEEARRLIEMNPRNKDVLFPYLNGEDLNSRPDQSPSRWVINFFDWPLDRDTAPDDYEGPVAADYPDCLAIVEAKVRPERAKNNRKVRRERWWQFAERAPELYRTIAGMERVLVGVRHAKHHALTFVPTGTVFSDATYIIVSDLYATFGMFHSKIHEIWARQYSGSLETRLRYSPSDCFDTFPLPCSLDGLEQVARSFYQLRLDAMKSRTECMTDMWNRFHDSHEAASDIRLLRSSHTEIDYAVLAAYGWTDLQLGHGFHETKQGTRFTISESARREVLARLLKLNHERHAQEVKQGLHAKKKPKSAKKPKEQDVDERILRLFD
jgi:hypothetical protein